MSPKATRRDFLKGAAAIGIAAGIPEIAFAQPERSRVVLVKNSSALSNSDNPGGSVDQAVVSKMIGQAVAKLMKKDRAIDAWKQLFKPSDIVGIKVNCLFGHGASTHPELAYAVADSLIQAGLKPESIIIWDRSTRDMIRSKFKMNKRGPGYIVTANDGEWDEKTLKYGSFDGKLTKIVTEQITAIINIPFMKDHGIAGISGALKNHYGTYDSPGRHHDNNCDPYLAELNALPVIKDKTRLVITDALRPMCDGGPRLNADALWDWHRIMVTQDPLAADYLQWKFIDERRKEVGLKTLEQAGRPPKWIKTAHSLGLGAASDNEIELVNI